MTRVEVARGVAAGAGQPVCHAHKFRQRAGAHLAHDLPAVNLHGHLAEVKLGGDLLIRGLDDDEAHDLPFARGESGVALRETGDERRISSPLFITLDRAMDRVEHVLIARPESPLGRYVPNAPSASREYA
jgi:hypothetical protein